MLTVAQALDKILEGATALAPQRLPIEQALGRTLAEDVVARESHPYFASSAMDGYALGSLEPVCTQIGSVAAGQWPDFPLEPGQCCRIFTGAPLPQGTVAVVPQEEARAQSPHIHFSGDLQPGAHMRPAGQHFDAGQTLLGAGCQLNSARIGLAALLGNPHLLCIPAPRVALISTGDELVELDQPLGPAQVRNSNIYAMQAQVLACGGQAVRLPIVPDQPQLLRQALLDCLDQVDAIVTCGGASVGDHDHVQTVLRELGADLQLWKVAMRPGKPLGYARLGHKPVIALPGNPVSCYVGFELFVRPLLDRLQGGPGRGLQVIEAQLAQHVQKKVGLRFFMRCRLQEDQVTLAGSQDSHLFRSIAESDGLLELAEEVQALSVGTPVRVLLWPWVRPTAKRG
ncbi:molybdopterin molybdotransferase MoeA [bacterium]|nr:molybdopterin molybdotransferase MoeA [bacterium]